MSEPKDYLAMIRAKEGDKLDYGVKGMKWGVRRSPEQLQAASKKGGSSSSKDGNKTLGEKNAEGGGSAKGGGGGDSEEEKKKPSVGELSAARYARLREQAELGKAHLMSDDDLKFFNARNEALNKINKLNKSDPGWISKVSKNVLQRSAEKSLQQISDALTNKYVTIPITEAIGKKK